MFIVVERLKSSDHIRNRHTKEISVRQLHTRHSFTSKTYYNVRACKRLCKVHWYGTE